MISKKQRLNDNNLISISVELKVGILFKTRKLNIFNCAILIEFYKLFAVHKSNAF